MEVEVGVVDELVVASTAVVTAGAAPSSPPSEHEARPASLRGPLLTAGFDLR